MRIRWLLLPAVPWICGGLLAIGYLAVQYGGGAEDLESRAMSVAQLLGEVQSIRAISAMSTGGFAFIAAFAFAVQARRRRAEQRRGLAWLIPLAVVPAIAVAIISMIGAPRIYFAFAGVLLLGAIALGIAGTRSLAPALSLLLSFTALVLGEMVRIESGALAALPQAAHDARPQLVLAMLQEIVPLETLLFRVLPFLFLPMALTVRSPRDFAIAAGVVLLPLLLHGATALVIREAQPDELGIELVQIPRHGPARIDLLLTDHSVEYREKPEYVALAAGVSNQTLRAFFRRASGSTITLVGDTAGLIERISTEEIAARDPSAVVFAKSYGAISARITSEPISTSTTSHLLLKDHSAQALIDALLAMPEGERVIHAE